MNKILMISTHFAPDTHVGAKRVTQFAKNLPHYGWEPIILTQGWSDYEGIDNSLVEQISGLKIYNVKCWRIKKKQKNIIVSCPPKKTINPIKKMFCYIKKLAGFDLGWLLPAYIKAKTIIDEYKINYVYAASPNPEALMIGYLLKKFRNIKLICDYRDPWTDNPVYGLPVLRHQIDSLLEKNIIKSADLIITVSERLKEMLAKKYSLSGRKSIKVIYNGYDRNIIGNISYKSRDDGKMKIVFWGTWGWAVSPVYFLRGLARFFDNMPKARGLITVEFIGSFREADLKRKTQQLIDDLGINKSIELIDFLPFNVGIEKLKESDVLLLIINKCEGFTNYRVPAKLFEYMIIGRPILGLTPVDGECAQLINQTGTGKVIDPENYEMIAKALGACFQEYRRGFSEFRPLKNEIQKYDRMVLTEKLADYLGQI